MELEELQKAWKELNDRVIRNELIHRQEIEKLLTGQKENHLEKMWRLVKVGLAVIIIMGLMLIYLFVASCKGTMPVLIWITSFFVVFVALVAQIAKMKNLRKIMSETNLEKQIKHILRFRLQYNRTSLLTYLIVIPFILTFLYYFGIFWNYVLIGCMLFLCIILDYFVFHFVHDKVKNIIHINEELSELDKSVNGEV